MSVIYSKWPNFRRWFYKYNKKNNYKTFGIERLVFQISTICQISTILVLLNYFHLKNVTVVMTKLCITFNVAKNKRNKN